MHPNTAFRDSALRYAELGYPVFPCVAGDKVPLTEHGFLDATRDSDRINQWWEQFPQANIGIATAGLVVIDIDGPTNPWPGAERAYELSSAPMSVTPRGGNHRVFRQPSGKQWRCTEGRLAEHVDTRADGGYFVVSPSVVEGKAYTWAPGLELDEPPDRLPEPPAWLVIELDRLKTPETKHISPDSSDEPIENIIPTGQRNTTLARLAGTMRRVGMSQPEIAAALLQTNRDRCVPPLLQREVERIAASIAGYAPDEIAVALAENHWELMYAESITDDAARDLDPGPIPTRLLQVPGFIHDVMTHTLETAPYPERALAFCGALALQAVLAGRKVRDEADNRTNLFILGLANSGTGKDYPRKVNQQVLLEVGLAEAIGDAFASGEGIEDCLFVQPAMLFQTDEIDTLMARIHLAKDVRHEGVMNVLLKMFTSASSFYPLRVKAGRESGVIDEPCLCIFGTAIPKHYYEALSMKMLSNGFFARMLILETGKRGRGQEATVRELPASIRETAQWWAEFCPGSKRNNLAAWHPVPRVITATPEATKLLSTFRERADDHYSLAEDQGNGAGMAIWARANEKARRLALIHACSVNHAEPRIEADAARWASEFVEHQTRRMLFMASEYVSENDFEARCKKVVTTLRDWRVQHGETWMPFWRLSRKHPWSNRDHEELRITLVSQRLIEYQELKTGGAPQRLYRLA